MALLALFPILFFLTVIGVIGAFVLSETHASGSPVAAEADKSLQRTA